MSGTKEHRTWMRIKEKCTNPNHSAYPRYGAKGVTFDYQNDFIGFIEEVGRCPEQSGKWSIERLNPNLGYVKGNMKWLETAKQSYNKTKFKNNTSGVTGVYQDNTGWRAEWWRSGVKNRKWFKDFQAAVDYRNKMISQLIDEGFPYTEHHGL